MSAPAPLVPPLLELRGITKAYPGCVANDRIDLAVAAGEIHAVLGENGAGKSTLMKIVAGVTRPDSGAMLWRGSPVALHGPAEARRLGVGMVFQHFTLFETVTVTENVMLGGIDGSRAAVSARIAAVAKRYGLAVDPDRHVHHLSVGERQRVEILRCLIREPHLIILDEPTSVLTPQEADALFETLRRLAGEGRAILFISHKLDEVRALCHSATVLRGGKVVATCDPRRESAAGLARLMVGADVSVAGHGQAQAKGAPRLTLSGLSLPPDNPHGVALAEIDLTVHDGEIVGIAGVAGNGQSELLAALSGERPAPRAEAIRIGAKAAGRLDIAARRRLGLAVIPEERLGQGAVAELSLADNALMTTPPGAELIRRGLIRRDRLRDFAARIVQRFGVVAAGIDAEARSLSGGNMQKFIIGREILNPPRLLVAAHPTWGVDIGAAAAIHRALLDLRAGGCAILLVSEDLDELLAITDRIAVISGGRLSPALPTAAADRGHLGELMTGMKSAAHAA